MDKRILFKTVHGSRLYGLAHENSDEDFYTVLDKVKTKKAKYAKQSITDDEDSMVVDFGTWVNMCVNGVPQALEAMFSTMVLYDDLADFRAGFRAGTGVYERYLRTIKSFALAEDATIKKRRHSLRLALNLNEMSKTGRFNPTLSAEDADYITRMAHKSHDDVYGLALSIAW